MEIEKKVSLILKCSKEEKDQIETIIERLDEVENMVDGECDTCPLYKTCRRQARDDVCLIGAVQQTLEILAGKAVDSEFIYD